MVSVKAHFDGSAVVLDEPVTLAIGQAVRVIFDPAANASNASPKSRFGFARGLFVMRDDFNDSLDEFEDYR